MRYFHTAVFVLILVMFTLLSAGSARSESLTFDETSYVEVGLRAITEKNLHIEPYNPVLIPVISVLPVYFGLGVTDSPYLSLRLIPARFVTVFLGILTLIVLYVFVRSRFGRDSALYSVFFLAFEPTFLAHSHYITYETGSALFYLLAYGFWIYLLNRPTFLRLVFFSVFTGLAFAAKVPLIPFLATAYIFYAFRKKLLTFGSVLKNTRSILFSLLLIGLTVWSTYGFQSDYVIQPSQRSGRVSDRLLLDARAKGHTLVVAAVSFLKTRKLPLGGYLALVKNNIIRTQNSGVTFFLGNVVPKNEWYFMIINIVLKTSPVLLFLYISGAAAAIKKQTENDAACMIVPVISVIFVLSLLRFSPFIRYALPMYPFLAMLAATGLVSIQKRRFGQPLALGVMTYLLMVSLWYYPHFITYASEFSRPFARPFEILNDSNLDWGQGLFTLQKTVLENRLRVTKLLYFGRDNPSQYGFVSTAPYLQARFEDLCMIHDIKEDATGFPVVVLDVTGWYYCGYYRMPRYDKSKIVSVSGESFLLFRDSPVDEQVKYD